MSTPIIRKAYVDTSEGQIHYRYVTPTANTTPRTPMVFLHKSASSSASFENLMTYYSSLGHPCWAPDMPGFGNSFDPAPRAEPYDIPWFVKIETEALLGLGLLEPGTESTGFHIVGHHSGSVLAPEIASQNPDFVKSITLIGPSVMTAEERTAMKATHLAPYNLPVPDGSHLLKTWNYLVGSSAGKLPLEVLHRETLDHARAWEGRTRIYGAIWNFDTTESILKVKCPILALCSEEDVLWTYFGRVKEAREDAITAVVDGANFIDEPGSIKHIDALYAGLK